MKHTKRYNTLCMCIGVDASSKYVRVGIDRYKALVEGRERKKNALAVALVTQQDMNQAFFKIHPKHVYTGPEFIRFVTKVDHTRSLYGSRARSQ